MRKFKCLPVLVILFFIFLHVYTKQRYANLIHNQFSKIHIYCQQNSEKKGIIARSQIQCASKCLPLFSPNCKAFIWKEIDKTCTHIDDTVKGDVVDILIPSELDIYTGYKDGKYHFETSSLRSTELFFHVC